MPIFKNPARFAATAAAIALVSATAADAEEPRFTLELEGGPVWQNRNDVQIPNDATGTRFSLVDFAGSGPWPALRGYLTWNISRKHGVRALFAPLTIQEAGVLEEETGFAGATFDPDTPTEAIYKFNSWRLTYRYRILDGDRWRGWIGLTAKIRDAKIRLEQPGVAAEDTDVGFVPLLHLAVDWRFAERWAVALDLDALAGGPGRAEDVSLKLRRSIGEEWAVAAGYRTLEGGADVDEVYNFAWLHYAVASVAYGF